MRGTGEYFSGVGAAPLEVPSGIRLAVAKRKIFNRCIAMHAPSPNRAAKCQVITAQWAREHGMAGMGEYFSGVGDDAGTPSEHSDLKFYGTAALAGAFGAFLFNIIFKK